MKNKMSILRVYAVFLRQWFLLRNNPTRLASLFLWLIIDIIQWGFISRYLETFGEAAFGFATVVLGAIILWEFMSRIQQGVMMAFLEDIWTQNFVNFFASPLKVGEYLTGLVATSVFSGFVGFLVMILIAGVFFGYNFFRIGLMIVPFMLLLFILGVAIGLLASAIIFRFGPTAEWISWPIPMVLSIFAGVFYPIATLPEPLQLVAKVIPGSYVFESVRGLLAGTLATPDLLVNLGWGLALSLVYLALAYRFFIVIYRTNLKTGRLARFGAEE